MGVGGTLGGGTEKVAGLGLTIPPPPRTDGFGGKSGLGVVGDSGDDTKAANDGDGGQAEETVCCQRS